MKSVAALFILIVFAVTAGAVAWQGERRAAYDAQTEIAQAEAGGDIAMYESQAEIAGYQASVDLAGIAAQLEIARLEMEMTKLDALMESEKIQAALAQTNALLTQSEVDLEMAKMERQRMWLMLALPSLAAIVVVCVTLVVLVVLFRRPVVRVQYPQMREQAECREIVKQAPVGVILTTKVERREGVDVYAVR